MFFWGFPTFSQLLKLSHLQLQKKIFWVPRKIIYRRPHNLAICYWHRAPAIRHLPLHDPLLDLRRRSNLYCRSTSPLVLPRRPCLLAQVLLFRSVTLHVALYHVMLGCFLMAYLEGNSLIVKRDVGEKNTYTLRASCVAYEIVL